MTFDSRYYSPKNTKETELVSVIKKIKHNLTSFDPKNFSDDHQRKETKTSYTRSLNNRLIRHNQTQ